MKYNTIIILVLALGVIFIGCAVFQPDKSVSLTPAANIQLPKVFGDHMVLQQKMPIPIWGTAEPGGKVTVKLGKQQKTDRVGANGKWRVDFAPMRAGGPHTLSVIGQKTLEFKDIMIGEVWICSGQSNMEWPVAKSLNAQKELANANYPNIRLFTVEHNAAYDPLSEVKSTGWQVCNPTSVTNFSAVGYFFGRNLSENLRVPIGLIHTSWGGTPAEAWTSIQSMQKLPDFAQMLEQVAQDRAQQAQSAASGQKLASWEEKFALWQLQLEQQDAGIFGLGRKWNDPGLDESDWQIMELPGLWESTPGLSTYDGIVWFRKTVTVPKTWIGQDLILHLGPIDDIDITWFNGKQIGSENVYNRPRIYDIPAEWVQESKNNITVRVLDYGGSGGFWGSRDQLYLQNFKGEVINLAGDWSYKVAVDANGLILRPLPPIRVHHQPTTLYNAMLAPLIPYGIRGAIWYQGEANASRAFQYRTLFPTMIRDWRTHWGQGDFPFLFVQLANYKKVQPEPMEDDWAELREAQLMTLALPNTGMAVAIDIGEADDIHPKNKQDVGKRLALNARKLVYGQNVTYSGPIYQSFKIEGDKIRLYFRHADGGLVARDHQTVQGFAIAGNDRKFHWAEAVIAGESVVVSSSNVAEPVAVRYAWASNPVCNLYNKAGLPASPFRTDDWPGMTQPK